MTESVISGKIMDEGNSVVTTSTGNSMVNVTSRDTISEPVSYARTHYYTLSVEDCVYRGEGNSNIVIALPKERKVIRFRKLPPQDADVSPEIAGVQRVKREAEFTKFVASHFLGPSLVQVPEIIRLSVENVAQLLEAIQHSRPDERRWKKIVDTYATRSPDYTCLQREFDSNYFVSDETFCVEIKPKQGYLQNDDTLGKVFGKCPYCLMQYSKLRNGTIQQRSTYCPLDLYSGVKSRMKQALRGLIKSPQNNLKIFKDGRMMYGGGEGSSTVIEHILKRWFQSRDSSHLNNNNNEDKEVLINEYIEQFCDLICEALLRPTATTSKDLNYHRFNYIHGAYDADDDSNHRLGEPIRNYIDRANKFLHSDPCNFAKEGEEDLPSDSVLGRILQVQKLPFINAEYVYKIYSRYREALTDDMIYTDLIETYELEDKDASYFERKTTSTTEITADVVRCLQNYLLFTCARDCSILISFREIDPTKIPSEHNDDVIRTSHGSNFVYSIGITDIDPKSLHCIDKHRQRDLNILKAIISETPNERKLQKSETEFHYS